MKRDRLRLTDVYKRQVHNIPVFMLVQFIGGLGYASLTAIFMANAIKHLDENQKAAGMGLYQALYSAGLSLIHISSVRS